MPVNCFIKYFCYTPFMFFMFFSCWHKTGAFIFSGLQWLLPTECHTNQPKKWSLWPYHIKIKLWRTLSYHPRKIQQAGLKRVRFHTVCPGRSNLQGLIVPENHRLPLFKNNNEEYMCLSWQFQERKEQAVLCVSWTLLLIVEYVLNVQKLTSNSSWH